MSSEALESDLLRQATGGDRAALSQLLLLHYDGLRQHIAGRLSGDLQPLLLADDILHQTLVRATQAIGSYQLRREGAFLAWLKTIANNLIKDARKRRHRERRATAAEAPQSPGGESSSWVPHVDRLAGEGSTPSEKGQRRENARRLRAALAALREDEREVIERYYFQEQSLEEIAETLGSSKDSIRGICYRARKRLRALMGRSSLYFSG
jgi:RNA polymerase sigma-70 factor (subfamily 1)